MSVDGATGANRTCWESSLALLSNCEELGYDFFFNDQATAQSFLDSMTFTAGATVDATTLLAGGIYEFWDDSWDGSQNVPGYWMLSVNGATIVDNDYTWSVALNKFLPESYNTEDLMLTSTGWQLGTDDVADASFSANQATLNIRAPDNEIVQTWVMNLEQMDISGREIGLYAPHTILDNVNATFTAGAQSIKETSGASMNYTQLHVWDGCAEYVTWGNNCNILWRRQMTGTDVAVPLNPATDLSFIDTAGATIELGQHNNSGPNGTSLLGIFSGSTISYWTVNWDAGTTAVDTGITSTFTYSTEANAVSAGVDVIEYTVPTNIPGYYDFNLSYDEYDNEIGVLAVQGGYLRHGEKEVAASDTYYELNDIAANDVFNNQPIAPAVYGSWVLTNDLNDPNYPTAIAPNLITFFADGNYMHSGLSTDPVLSGTLVTGGILPSVSYDGGTITAAAPELGPYTWDSITGDYTVNPLVDANEWAGLNDTSNGNNSGNITVSGDVMTLTNADGAVTFNRVTTDTSPIVGSWVLADPNDPVVFTFFANGYYNESQTCNDHYTTSTASFEPIDGGIEYGTYAWDEGVTNVLSGVVIIDTDGECGIHSTNDVSTAAGGFTVTIEGDVMTAVIPDEPDVLFYRVQ